MGTFGIPLKAQALIVEQISDAVSDMASAVREAMARHPEFSDTGKRMLMSWQAGVDGLRDKRTYAVVNPQAASAAKSKAPRCYKRVLQEKCHMQGID